MLEHNWIIDFLDLSQGATMGIAYHRETYNDSEQKHWK